MMADKSNIREWVDSDESKIRVVRWPSSGKVIFDTSPETDGIGTMVELTRDQVQELARFIGFRE